MFGKKKPPKLDPDQPPRIAQCFNVRLDYGSRLELMAVRPQLFRMHDLFTRARQPLHRGRSAVQIAVRLAEHFVSFSRIGSLVLNGCG